MQSHKSERNLLIIIFSLVIFAWLLFIQSAISQSSLSWQPYLLYSRIFVLVLAIALLITSIKKVIPNILPIYFVICMILQASFASLEDPKQVEYYQYVSYFVLLISLSFKGKFKTWLKVYAPIILTTMVAPLSFKDAIFFESVGSFAFHLTTPVAIALISLAIIRMSTSKYEMSLKNDALQKELLETERKSKKKIKIELNKAKDELTKAAKVSAFGEFASQVAHDIRSPLAALDMVVKDNESMPKEEKRVLIRAATSRINDIANNLLDKKRELEGGKGSTKEVPELENRMLSALLNPILSEKRTQFRDRPNISIDFQEESKNYGVFVEVSQREFRRVISNIINNAVEVLKSKGKIVISLDHEEDGKDVRILIKDNGEGIPSEILPKLGQKGKTYGKEKGNGLGLFHAKKILKSWNGYLKIESTVGVGTTVIITIPKTRPPQWFIHKLTFKEKSTVVVIDDDTSIHQIWDGRFDSCGIKNSNVRIIHFSSPKEVTEWVEQNGSENCFFLVDFEFIGHKDTNGLKIVEGLDIANKAAIVTSRYEEEHIIKDCNRLKVSLLPKNMANYIPISFEKSTNIYNDIKAVLIDDDTIVRLSWTSQAKKAGIKFQAFERPEEFMEKIDQYDKNVSIYIDSGLGNDVKGEDVAKILYEQGIRNIYLATGYEKDSFDEMPWIKDIIGKHPPF